MAKQLPRSGNAWQLYTSSMKCGQAARALTSALKKAEKALRKALKGVVTREAAESAVYNAMKECMYPVMNQYASFGAYDSEPCWVATDYLNAVAQEKGFESHCW